MTKRLLANTNKPAATSPRAPFRRQTRVSGHKVRGSIEQFEEDIEPEDSNYRCREINKRFCNEAFANRLPHQRVRLRSGPDVPRGVHSGDHIHRKQQEQTSPSTPPSQMPQKRAHVGCDQLLPA